jgi:hypothetical protein
MALPDYPLVNQLNSPTFDGRVDENRWFNCVIASLVGMILYYRPDLRGKLSPDSLKDAVLGEGYANQGTDAAWFVQYIAKHYGLKLSQVSGNAADIVFLAHICITKGIPMLFTEPDPYVDISLPKFAGWTHVCTWFREIPGGLEAIDPFGAKLIDRSDAAWSNTVIAGGSWIMEDEEMNPPIDLGIPVVANFFASDPKGGWLCKQTGRNIHGEILTYYTTMGATPLHGLDDLGLPQTNEIPIEQLPYIGGKFAALAGKGITVQFFELGPVMFDPTNLIDKRPGGGRVYRAKPYGGGPGTDPELSHAQALLAIAQAHPTTPVVAPDDHTAVVWIKKIVGAA